MTTDKKTIIVHKKDIIPHDNREDDSSDSDMTLSSDSESDVVSSPEVVEHRQPIVTRNHDYDSLLILMSRLFMTSVTKDHTNTDENKRLNVTDALLKISDSIDELTKVLKLGQWERNAAAQNKHVSS
jgi:hypothetical protein